MICNLCKNRGQTWENLKKIWAIGLIESLHLFWNLAYTFAFDDHWWPWSEFEFLYPKCIFYAQEFKNRLLKICTYWPLVPLTWFGPPMMSKMLFLCIGAQKYNFKKIALDDFWRPWPDFDHPLCTKCSFCAYELKNTLSEILHWMTFGDIDLIWPPMMLQMLFLCIGAQKYAF